MAHSKWRADFIDACSSPQRSIFFDHAGPDMVCVGVVVRHPDRGAASVLRTEWGSLALCVHGGCYFHASAFAVDAARNRTAFGGRADAIGPGCRNDSFVRASTHR